MKPRITRYGLIWRCASAECVGLGSTIWAAYFWWQENLKDFNFGNPPNEFRLWADRR